MTDTEFILDSITWSYTSVNAYATCPLMFRLSYIDALPKTNNAFAQWGSFCHSILERYYKGGLARSELAAVYRREYRRSVTKRFPYNRFVNLNRSYYEAGHSYFSTFEDGFKGHEILGVEQEIRFSIGGYPFVGFIDLILRDESDGKIVLCDHKSKAKFKSRAEKAAYLRQLYLYALYIKLEYGEYPKTLLFNMFRAGKRVEEPFEENALCEAKQWLAETIRAIYRDCAFAPSPNRFFCDNLCSVGEHCPHSKRCREGQ